MKKLYAIIVPVFIGLNTNAQPANDNCSGAILLTVNSTCVPTAGTVAGSTTSTPPTTCWSLTNNITDVWYKFVATATTHTVELACSSNFYGVEELMSSCTGPALNCMGSGPGVDNQMSATGLIPGNTYYIRVYDYYIPSTQLTFSVCVWSSSTGIGAVDPVSRFTVFPNPGIGTFTIQTSELNSQLIITNTLGQKMVERKINSGETEIDLQAEAKGIYFINLITEQGTITKKLIIQ